MRIDAVAVQDPLLCGRNQRCTGGLRRSSWSGTILLMKTRRKEQTKDKTDKMGWKGRCFRFSAVARSAAKRAATLAATFKVSDLCLTFLDKVNGTNLRPSVVFPLLARLEAAFPYRSHLLEESSFESKKAAIIDCSPSQRKPKPKPKPKS